MKASASPGFGGTASVPGDKSIAHRALILSAMAEGTSRISRLPTGEDVVSTRKAVEALGATVEPDGDDWLVSGAQWRCPDGPIDCGNSGTSARLLMGAAAGFEGLTASFVGDESLSRRPMRRVVEPLTRMGARFESGETLPLTLHGAALGGIDHVQTVASAQVKTAILLAGLRSAGPVRVVEPFASRNHSEVMLAQFGVEGAVEETVDGHAVSLGDQRSLTATDVIVSGDPSSAAFLFAGAAITGGVVTVTDLNVNATRTGFLEALDAMGCEVEFVNPRDWAGEPVADVTVSRTRPLKPLEWHRDKVPATIDELPLLAIVAAFADGESLLEGLGELRVKESDRLGAVIAGLAASGVSVFPDRDDLRVLGRGEVRGGSHIMVGHDHRIAMGFLTMGLASVQPITVDDTAAIATSFPNFVEVMQSLGAQLEENDVSVNSFGTLFRLSTWGESHGPAIGCMVDGCPPGLALDESFVQRFLDLRRPGTGKNVSPRQEPDAVRIVSGVYEGKTTGTPIAMIIDNIDARSKDYPKSAPYRPGHADYSYDAKYGFRDPRGGGRASARETAMRVAGGAVARLVIPEVEINSRVVAIGGEKDAHKWEAVLDAARSEGDSLGALVECSATGIPAGWGAPVYAKLDAVLAGAMMSIPAVKGVEIGEGLSAADLKGSENADAMRAGADGPRFDANHSGGIAGGISTGQPVVVRASFKPTSSIRKVVPSVNAAGDEVEASTRGRHDPCVGIRGAPVMEAMMALVLADAKLMHRGQCG